MFVQSPHSVPSIGVAFCVHECCVAFHLLAHVSLWERVSVFFFVFLFLAIPPVEIIMEHNNGSEINRKKKPYKMNRKKCIICLEHVACYHRMRMKLKAQKRWNMRKMHSTRANSKRIYLFINLSLKLFCHIPISRFNAVRDTGSDFRNEPGSEGKSATPIFVWQMVLSAFRSFNCETNIPRVSLFRNNSDQTRIERDISFE